ncbi:dihydrodipicolinate synthase family protein [Dyadobacter crusticola]|uniref:dihydrodipicolinate synthase family protein n=1 Tax=Dyadobacter crusticola TaxID=292407 RepID=UPI0004E1C32E|nr:dihydrodipicolinate synthase family protein [Dyadobacter crusticola]
MTNAQTSRSLPQGFIPVMLTPFLESGAVDFEGLKMLTEMYLEAGAAGLFANCLSSEMFELTESERLEVTQTVVDQVAGRVPVVATGTLGGSIEQQADFVKRIYLTGIDAVIVITGLLAEEHDNEAVFHTNVKRLLALTGDIPLGFYECPVPYKRLIDSRLLGELVQSQRIVYHKDTCLDIEEVVKRIAATEGFRFGLYDAYMVNATASLRAGAAGLSCIQGNIYPELVVWMCNHFNDVSRAEEVERLQTFFNDSMDIVHTAYPIIAKYCLQKRGFPISLYTRRKVDELTEEVKERADKLLDEAAQLRSELGVESVFRNSFAAPLK